MTKNTRLPARTDLFRLGDMTYALCTYPDGKQEVLAQVGSDKFLPCPDGIPQGAMKYEPPVKALRYVK